MDNNINNIKINGKTLPKLGPQRCFRYIVPFSYKSGDEDLDAYELCNIIISKTENEDYGCLWLPNSFNELYSDNKSKVFDSVENIFLWPADEVGNLINEKSQVGFSIYKTYDKIFKCVYKNRGKSLKFSFKEVRLILCRNGLGFFCLEIDADEQYSIKDISDFQSCFYDLEIADKFISIEWYDWNNKEIKANIFSEYFGAELDLINDAINKHIKENEKKYKKGAKFSYNYFKKRNDFVPMEDTGYWLVLPGKALLYCVASLSYDEDSKMARKYAVEIVNRENGPDELIPKVNCELHNPYDNMFCCATYQGVTCLEAMKNGATKITQDFIEDHFMLYLNVLYRFYSILIYSSRLDNDMPACFDTRDYRQRIIDYCRDFIQYHVINIKLRHGSIEEWECPPIKRPVLDPNHFTFKMIHDIYRDINIFIAKSAATSVSDDWEETEYFKYLQKVFCITENIRTLIEGLPAIEALGKDYIENKYNSRVRLMTVILGLVAIVALISAGHDGVEFYVKSLGEENGVEYYSFWFPITLGVCMISVIGLVFSVMR